MRDLLAKGVSIEERDHGGWTPFIKSCEAGQLKVAKELFNHGAKVDATSSFGWTALGSAAKNGHLDVVKWLIKKGADVNRCENSDKLTPLWEAVSNGHADVCEYLLAHGGSLSDINREKTPLIIQAAYKGHLGAVKWLLSKNVDPNTVDVNYGNTTFLTACKWGHLDIAKHLVSLGCIQLGKPNNFLRIDSPSARSERTAL